MCSFSFSLVLSFFFPLGLSVPDDASVVSAISLELPCDVSFFPASVVVDDVGAGRAVAVGEGCDALSVVAAAAGDGLPVVIAGAGDGCGALSEVTDGPADTEPIFGMLVGPAGGGAAVVVASIVLGLVTPSVTIGWVCEVDVAVEGVVPSIVEPTVATGTGPGAGAGASSLLTGGAPRLAASPGNAALSPVAVAVGFSVVVEVGATVCSSFSSMLPGSYGSVPPAPVFVLPVPGSFPDCSAGVVVYPSRTSAAFLRVSIAIN